MSGQCSGIKKRHARNVQSAQWIRLKRVDVDEDHSSVRGTLQLDGPRDESNDCC